MNTATATRRSVATGTFCRRCRRRDPEPGHPHCLTCAGALAKIEVVRQPTPEPEKRPLATQKRVELAVAWTLLALVGWGFIKIAPFLWLMTKALAVLLPVWFFLALAGPRPPPIKPIATDSTGAASTATGGNFAKTRERGKIAFVISRKRA